MHRAAIGLAEEIADQAAEVGTEAQELRPGASPAEAIAALRAVQQALQRAREALGRSPVTQEAPHAAPHMKLEDYVCRR